MRDAGTVSEGWIERCIACGATYEIDVRSYSCERCSNPLELKREAPLSRSEIYESETPQSGIWRYRRALPIEPSVKPVSLWEGMTPLVRAARLGRTLRIRELYVKNEGQNPTGSFKDRGMTVAVTRGVQLGAKNLVCASTGNTAASMAAYGAKAGLTSWVSVPSGKVAAGKMAQVYAYGARIIRVDGDFDGALSVTLKTAADLPELFVMNSVNPYRLEGQKTNSLELFEQLGFRVPDYVVLPVGNAGNISAIWKGFRELRDWGVADSLPRMIGVQAAGASPIVDAVEKGLDMVTPIREPNTIASAIRIGNPASWRKALSAIYESHGTAVRVTDEEIVAARMELASSEGLFVEPASAAPIAALRKVSGRIVERDSTVVCIATGNGLKDQESVRVQAETAPLISSKEEMVELLAMKNRVASRRR